MTCALTRTGSMENCGCEPWPPLPVMTISKEEGCAMMGPGVTLRWPSGQEGQLW